MSDENDPFEEFEEVAEDREGDPFEQLEDADTDEDGEDGEADEDHYDGHDVTPAGHRTELDGEDTADEWTGDQPREAEDDARADTPPDPFADSDFEVREEPDVRRGEESAPGEPFSEQTDRSVDPFEQPREHTDDPFEQPRGPEDDPFEEGGVFEEMDVGDLDPDEVWGQLTDAQERGSVSELQDRVYAEVSKHSYCEQCEFFSSPPDIHCSHEGTEILEFTDMEQVRVVDCPVVAERKELEEE